MAISFFNNVEYDQEPVNYIRPVSGNYLFDTTLTSFGLMRERKFTKVNRFASRLKLANLSDVNSVYPMLDEFGYTYVDFFIFKSSWDLQYHIETR